MYKSTIKYNYNFLSNFRQNIWPDLTDRLMRILAKQDMQRSIVMAIRMQEMRLSSTEDQWI